MRRRVRPTRAIRPAAAPIIGVQLTRLTAGTQPKTTQSMSIVRNISGPFESDLGGGSGALPGTEPGLVGSYQYEMQGILSTDTLEWRGDDGGTGVPDGNAIEVTLVSSAANIAIFSYTIPSGIGYGVALIYCSVNGTEFVQNFVIAAP